MPAQQRTVALLCFALLCFAAARAYGKTWVRCGRRATLSSFFFIYPWLVFFLFRYCCVDFGGSDIPPPPCKHTSARARAALVLAVLCQARCCSSTSGVVSVDTETVGFPAGSVEKRSIGAGRSAPSCLCVCCPTRTPHVAHT